MSAQVKISRFSICSRISPVAFTEKKEEGMFFLFWIYSRGSGVSKCFAGFRGKERVEQHAGVNRGNYQRTLLFVNMSD